MLAEAAMAIALIDESSVAVTEIGPPAVTVPVPVVVLRMLASTTAAISLKLMAPVAATPMAEAFRLIATARAMPKVSESIDPFEPAVTGTAPSASIVESSTTARVVVSMSLIVTEMPSAGATASFWLRAMATAIAPPTAVIDDSSVAVDRHVAAAAVDRGQGAAVEHPGLGDVADLVPAQRPGEAEGHGETGVRPGDAGGGADAEGEDRGRRVGVDRDVAAGRDVGVDDLGGRGVVVAPVPWRKLMAKAAPMATAAAVPLPETATEKAIAPATAMIEMLDRIRPTTRASVSRSASPAYGVLTCGHSLVPTPTPSRPG